jgi:hypothetical protein
LCIYRAWAYTTAHPKNLRKKIKIFVKTGVTPLTKSDEAKKFLGSWLLALGSWLLALGGLYAHIVIVAETAKKCQGVFAVPG